MESRPIRVLLVEDNPGDARLLQLTLEEAGKDAFELELAGRLSAGLDRLAAGDIEMVLLDLSLPDSHGLDTFSAVHAEAPQVPIVVLSGLDDRELAVTAVRLGAQDYLVKGKVDSDILVRAIRYAIERHETEQQIRQHTAELEEARSELEERAEALQEANERLQELDRLKSNFLASMTHELRTPLNSIIGFSEVLIEGVVGAVTPDQKECIDNILTSGEHLMTLINDILDLSKIEAGRLTLEPTPFNIRDLLGNVKSTVTPMVTKKAQILNLEAADGLPQLTADIFRIKQVLLNLLSNAYKFTPKEGSITLSCALVNPEAMLFSVSDSGPGIKPEDQEIIFEEFRQARKKKPDEEITGTGLGLAISRRLVEMHGGSLWVESEFGHGATFRFLVPVAGPPKEEPDAEVDGEVKAEQLAIVVESDRLLNNLLGLHLRQAGYTPLPRYSEAGVLTLTRELRPVFIALDVGLEDQAGWRLLKGLKTHPVTKSIPVLAMAAHEPGRSGCAVGTTDLLIKPVRPDDVRVLACPSAGDDDAKSSSSVLLVDDDIDTINALREGLQACCTLLVASDVQDGLKLAHSQMPTAILVDPSIDGLAGFDMIQQLRGDSATAGIPIVGLAPRQLDAEMQEGMCQRVRKLTGAGAVDACSLAADLVLLASAGATAEAEEPSAE